MEDTTLVETKKVFTNIGDNKVQDLDYNKVFINKKTMKGYFGIGQLSASDILKTGSKLFTTKPNVLIVS